ncbi:DUF1501 domain-containing protein [bacterium]|nr:DUF1501 domain-containing protein [bacterium]
MLTLSSGPPSRRQFLRAGGLGVAGVTLPALLWNEARADTAARPKSVIYVVLSGGPSQIDTWDPKPDAPDEYRGPFGTIPTRLTGVRLCEHFPMQAQLLDRATVLNGVRSVENDHYLSEVYTGLPRSAGNRPAFGSVASKLLGARASLPAYVSLHRVEGFDRFDYERPYYAGSQHAPFRPFGDALDDLRPVHSPAALDDRRALLAGLDRMRRELDATGQAAALDRFQARALELVTSPRARDAFDLSKEPKRNVERYGRGKYTHQTVKSIVYDWDVKPFILARRLVEAGVRVVTVQVESWDHHSGPESDIFLSYRHCLPALDRSVWALVTDLEERGLLDDVLVVVLGEFGRTPKIAQPGPGREHWADAGSAILFGGGLKVGQVVGRTDARAERSVSGTMTFQNVVGTIYHVLGIDPNTTLPDFGGRPTYLLDHGRPIAELV